MYTCDHNHDRSILECIPRAGSSGRAGVDLTTSGSLGFNLRRPQLVLHLVQLVTVKVVRRLTYSVSTYIRYVHIYACMHTVPLLIIFGECLISTPLRK